MNHPQDTPNSYRVCSGIPNLHSLVNISEEVVFTTASGLPLPSPTYLKIHATCCRVVHMSGAADFYPDPDDDGDSMIRLRSSPPDGCDFSAVL